MEECTYNSENPIPTVDEVHQTVRKYVKDQTGIVPEFNFSCGGHAPYLGHRWHEHYRPVHQLSSSGCANIFANPYQYLVEVSFALQDDVSIGTLKTAFRMTFQRLGVDFAEQLRKKNLPVGGTTLLFQNYRQEISRRYDCEYVVDWAGNILQTFNYCARSHRSLDMARLHSAIRNDKGVNSPIRLSTPDIRSFIANPSNKARCFISPRFSAAGILIKDGFVVWSHKEQAFIQTSMNECIPLFGVEYVDDIEEWKAIDMMAEYVKVCEELWETEEQRLFEENNADEMLTTDALNEAGWGDL